MEKPDKSNHSQCTGIIRPVQDALDVLSGKWKLPIIVALLHGYKRFSEISRQVPGITDRMLSKELRDLELNQLVKRKVYDTFPVTVEYTMTPYGETLKDVISALHIWGEKHRQKIFGAGLVHHPVDKSHLG
ncbi:helix-turn-helix domain-containing protein [Algoriphagus halophytocola]|uniref:Helix-turn-helix transcriptional regulator n=1 Tax=Algoriphagus halophytocola TaxID=2991499 RepID=A0ABY6MIA7_9BACT|nr:MULTISPECIES: helix-turn-helix domain-containing protein [unclassified Algoriphagus]UZD23358.1 helix-turn-helix transcriptional regulator [Algoriphagus sp. TR-M5]WBL44653.1 helix-turn-helix domain-containing protein [Algoriphagus sp. TR-M9]